MTTEAPTISITLPPLHASQREIAESPARFKVVCCGRRWGKTLLATTICLKAALEGGRIWHVAPTYKQTLEAWGYLMRLVSQMPPQFASIQVSELMVTFATGGSIQMRTGDSPNNLRGSGLDGVVLDEAAVLKPDVWDLALRPSLADRQGWALFISTPQHFNQFYDWYMLGEDPSNHDWASWQHPTWDNPHIPESEIEAARRDMLPEDFDQEFGASFTAVGGAVFPILSADRMYFLREMPKGTIEQLRRKGVGMDWGTTKEHQAAVVGGGITGPGAVWITSAWMNGDGSPFDWNTEAERVKRTIGADFARVDTSQSSNLATLKTKGFEVNTGLRDVETRIGALKGLIARKSVFFDANDPGVRELYRHLCEYRRYPDSHANAGKIVEENDDDVDACLYLIAELVQPKQSTPPRWRISDHAGAPAMKMGRLN